MRFARFVETNRQLDTANAVDNAIDQLNRSLFLLEKQTKTLQSMEKSLFENRTNKITKKYIKELETREYLHQDCLEKREAVWNAMDEDPEWIFKYPSPVGEALVRTRSEALQLASKFVIINNKLLTDYDLLLEWQKTNAGQVYSNLTPVKLGINGGTYRFPIINTIYISALNW